MVSFVTGSGLTPALESSDAFRVRQRLLVIESDERLRESLLLALAEQGHEADCVEPGKVESDRLRDYDAIFCGREARGPGGTTLLSWLATRAPDAERVALDGFEAEPGAPLPPGVHERLGCPYRPSELRELLGRLARERHWTERRALLEHRLERAREGWPIVAASAAMIDVLERVERLAELEAPVVVWGEPGSGRADLARALHAQSPRRAGPLLEVDARDAADALEARLFGGASGALRGAERGLLRAAHGGCLLVEGLDALPLALRERITEVVREQELPSPSDAKPLALDVRLLATADSRGPSPADTDSLGALPLELPALRDRREDLPLLVDHCFASACRRLGRSLRSVSDAALERLADYPWPGNLRELENVVERAVLLARGPQLTPHELPASVLHPPAAGGAQPDLGLKRQRRRTEAELIRRALQETGGNRTHAARLLEISHRALLYKLKDYGIRD